MRDLRWIVGAFALGGGVALLFGTAVFFGGLVVVAVAAASYRLWGE